MPMVLPASLRLLTESEETTSGSTGSTTTCRVDPLNQEVCRPSNVSVDGVGQVTRSDDGACKTANTIIDVAESLDLLTGEARDGSASDTVTGVTEEDDTRDRLAKVWSGILDGIEHDRRALTVNDALEGCCTETRSMTDLYPPATMVGLLHLV